MPKNYIMNIFIHPTTDEEISTIIDSLKHCAVGWDELPSSIFKENKDPLSKLLMHLINLSLTNGVFPEELKLANLIPIFKSGDNDKIGNYRPVSLLTIVSKVFEKVFFYQIIIFLNFSENFI